MFAVTWQMIKEVAEGHIVTLRSLLSQFIDRHCSNPRDRVFAILNLLRVRKMDLHRYIKADYLLLREDVFFMVFAFWEMLYVENPLNH
jgi:hypothetical protein